MTFAEIVAYLGYAQKAAFFIHHIVYLMDAQALPFHQKFHNRRIYVAAARSHHKAFQRREAHTSIYGFPI